MLTFRSRGVVPLATVPPMSDGTCSHRTTRSFDCRPPDGPYRPSYFSETWVRFRQRPTPSPRDKRDANGTGSSCTRVATSGAPTNSNSVSKLPPLAQRKDPSKTTDVNYVASYKDILCHYDPEKQLLVSYSFKDVKHSVVWRLEDGFRTSDGFTKIC